ncbi:MAG: methyltransferase domain-containing protein [Tetrasphaera sp.]|nr:methyltransferase domain-containing protein [Tetrasphaera sp.]
MHCDYFTAGECRSCTLMTVPYAVQLADKDARARAVLASVAADAHWLPPQGSAESGFRNKAKLVVGGRAGQVTLGILDQAGRGVDLQGCGLYEEPLSAAFGPIATWVDHLRLEPYSVPERRGELKHILLTASPGGELMVRLVLRSTHRLAAIRNALPQLLAAVGSIVVVTANIHPEHKAVLEGEREIVLTDARELSMRVNDIDLRLGPRSFFQTNTEVAAALYRQAAGWANSIAPQTIWDLYCGVGGFAGHLWQPGRAVLGVEVSEDAVAAARHTVPGARFIAGDATAYARDADRHPDLVVVNPPRRGLGAELADWLQTCRAKHLIYSSCNVNSLAADLARMPSWRVEEVRLFDMFPQTGHAEVAARISRSG